MDPALLSADTFQDRQVPAFGRRVFRLGFAATAGISEPEVREALEDRAQYVFFNPTARKLVAPLREALKRDRARYVVATGPTLGWFPGQVRKRVETALRLLGTDHLDVLQLYWLGKTAAATEAVLGEMIRLREQGKVRALGTSIHDRMRAGKLAEDSPLDLLMIRYNAAHPGAEKDVFPHLAKRRPAVVAYTATSWRRLLKRPRGWQGPVPTAADCYRWVLTSPHVDVVLCAPKNAAQWHENVKALEQGPLDAEKDAWMREFGRVVHG